jgi:hypothetical protein
MQFAETEDEAKIVVDEESIFNQIKAFVITLETELKKAFMFTENSDIEYSERLQDLIKLVDFMYKLSGEMSSK